jgi:AcrR family transcriptional regulator
MAARKKQAGEGSVGKTVVSREYHHGDLRRAVLKAAFREVAKKGVRGLTLREVARKIGVTHAAPYHHFKDRDALLDAMAEEAFAELDRAMRESKEGLTDPSARLLALGRTYVDFARKRPERVEVMFRRADAKQAASDGQVGHPSFLHLVDAIAGCQAAAIAPAGDPFDIALSAWCVVHGFAMLWIEGPLASMPPYAERFEALRERMLSDFVAGLAAQARELPPKGSRRS